MMAITEHTAVEVHVHKTVMVQLWWYSRNDVSFRGPKYVRCIAGRTKTEVMAYQYEFP